MTFHKMQIDTNVSEADVGNVVEGQDVDFLVDAFPYTTFHGKVIQVRNSPTTVQNVVTYDAVIGVSNPEFKLKPGMTANISIIIAHRDDAILIPNGAFRVRMPDELAQRAMAAPNAVAGKWHLDTRTRRTKKTEGDPRCVRAARYMCSPTAKKFRRPVKIKIGISDGVNTEVTEGLKEGDKVVTSIFNTHQPITAADRRIHSDRQEA